MELQEKLSNQLWVKLQRQRDAVLITEAHLELLRNVVDSNQMEVEDAARTAKTPRGAKKSS